MYIRVYRITTFSLCIQGWVTMTLQEILASKRLGDIFILARYFYRIGEPIISDQVYEKIVAAVKHFRPENLVAYLDRTYDDDPVPIELLKEIGVEPIKFYSVFALSPSIFRETMISCFSIQYL